MTEAKTQFPMIKWVQRKERFFITISVVHSKKPIVNLTYGKRIKYQGTDGKVNLPSIFNYMMKYQKKKANIL